MNVIKNHINKIQKLSAALLLLLCAAQSNAQTFVLDTADHRIAYYRTLISRNGNTVRFIEYSLAQQGIPKSLRNLALIESGLQNKSLSWAKAAGTWQFMPSAAAFYGMTVSKGNDERYDLYKSTFAAARYLGDLYDTYHDWKMVVAAYNCGTGNVNKAIQRSGSTNYDLLSPYLPYETQEHVRKFILACYATNELHVMSKTDVQPERTDTGIIAVKYDEPVTRTEINGGYKIIVIAQYLEMPVEKIRGLNPDLEADLARTGRAGLILPVDKMPDFLLQKTEILNLSIN